MSQKTSRNQFWINPSHLLAGLLATGLSVPALIAWRIRFQLSGGQPLKPSGK
jgi:hypothetical protein